MTDDQALEDTLNAHAEDGWKTVAVVPTPRGDELVPPFALAL